ncbi:hypothetical protein GFK32_25145, partial [Salmonella enterica subsp. enterica serovar Enteritidis]|nr:hypothetical protein [Salmonella enterica subsp. enterica serovar Enteritidis]
HYFYNVNDFNSSNGTKHHWEITNTFRYHINNRLAGFVFPTITPVTNGQ